ncbi:MAG: DNA polymerase III subunit gamma/tau, partial [Planctomycetota bacterium]
MAYVVLARKYRPRTFEEVAGQDVSSGVLRGAIAEERVGHAYLFSGPRGTGKTTTARIFAKALNCEKGPTPEPCGVCDRCVAADAGNDVDIVEIDAASHTGVDSVRELRDQAAYMPLRARYKIYIIDEVHMLSRAAFNALLKTLEEPPPHVKFLFATTEPHKVIDTVLSRCQQLRLSSLPERTITTRLDEIFAAEKVEAEEGVTAELARLARGGMRDALSLADQLLALVGSKPRRDDIERLASGAASGGIDAILDALEAADRSAVLAALPSSEGDETELLENLLRKLRVGLLAVLVGTEHAALVAGEEVGAQTESVADEAAAARAKRLGPQRIELWLTELVHARERMLKLPTQSRLLFELCLLDLCRPELSLPIGELVARLDALE